MKKLLAIAASLVGLVVVVGLVGVFVIAPGQADARLAKTYEVPSKDLEMPFPMSDEELEERVAAWKAAQAEGEESAEEDIGEPPAELVAQWTSEAALARGQHLMATRGGCFECHGADYGGAPVIDDPAMGRWVAPNITRGPGGLPEDFDGASWDRVLRHGVGHDGHTLSMPAVDWAYLSDQEVADLAFFVESQPPVDRDLPGTAWGPIGNMLVATGEFVIAAEVIDHDRERLVVPPRPEPTAGYGEHMAMACVGCHRQDFTGGPVPGGDPSWPPASNLTPHETGLKGWTDADWQTFATSGKRPDGTLVDASMAWKFLEAMTETERVALFRYLQSLPPQPMGT